MTTNTAEHEIDRSKKVASRWVGGCMILLLPVLWEGCQGDLDSWSPYLCESFSAVSTSSRTPVRMTESEPVSQVSQGLNAKLEALWRGSRIPVCWDPSAVTQVSALDRSLVQQAIALSWERALADAPDLGNSPIVHFDGWLSCTDDPDAAANGIHIAVTTGVPETFGLGRELKGLAGGMVLNFTFKTWSPACAKSEFSRQHCVEVIAIHEFGHALGLAHEQNRTDTPSTCTDPPQGEDGSIYLGQWDLHSVMNYCNPTWNNAGWLSPNDIAGIRTLYYPEAAAAYCASQPKASPLPSPSVSPSAKPASNGSEPEASTPSVNKKSRV